MKFMAGQPIPSPKQKYTSKQENMEKENHRLKSALVGDMLVPRMV